VSKRYTDFSQQEDLQEKVEDLIIFIFDKEQIIEIDLDSFYEIFIDYCETNLSIFYIKCYLLNLICRDIIEIKGNKYRLINSKTRKKKLKNK
jgi:hypothetical protein